MRYTLKVRITHCIISMLQSRRRNVRNVRIVLSALWLFHQNVQNTISSSAVVAENTASEIMGTFSQPSQPTASGISNDLLKKNSADPRLLFKQWTTKTDLVLKEPPSLKILNRDIMQSSNRNHKSSSIASDAYRHDIIPAGNDHSADSNTSRYQFSSEFKPVLSNSAFTPVPKVLIKKLDDASSKRSLPSESRHSYESPIYDDDVFAPSKGSSFDETYAKYYGESDSSSGTADTFAQPAPPPPSKINPHHHVYGTPHQQALFSIHESKMKPHKEYFDDDYWKNIMHPYLPPSADHNLVQDGFVNHHEKYVLGAGNGHDVNNPAYANNVRRKNSLLGILTALIPLGLLLSALHPRVVIINSTNSARPEAAQQKAFIRKLEEELQTNDISVMNDAETEHPKTSSSSCIKLRICEAFLRKTDSSISPEEHSLWHLLQRYSNNVHVDLNAHQDIYAAVTQKQCSKLNCEIKAPI